MAKDFFDDVFDNKLLFDKKALYKNKDVKVQNIIREEAKKQMVASDEDLERLLANVRNNPERLFTQDEANMISAKLEDNKKEAKKLLKRIKNIKDFHYEKASKAEDKFELDISKNSQLKRSANRVFGGNKKKITYEDYATLLEMKKELQMNESLELLAGEETNGNV
jgi:hypothetical protein